jgi:chromosomal replication initiator protein
MVIENEKEKAYLNELYDLMPARMQSIYLDAAFEFEQKHYKMSLSKDDIIRVVCEVMEISPELISLKTRKREIVVCRQMVYHVLSMYFDYSLAFIGRLFKQDHATVIHAKKTIRNLLFSDREILKRYETIKKMIYETD